MLVGVGATLVILTSIYLGKAYSNIQVDRMGSQVISGIGFLGAGTIIRQGNTVQGLTTAAGLWAVACIGLAVGTGFYLGSITATLMVLTTLVVFKRIETQIMKKDKRLTVSITLLNKPGQVSKIYRKLEDLRVSVLKIEFQEHGLEQSDEFITIEMELKLQDYDMKNDIINQIISEDGVVSGSKSTGGWL